MILSIRLGKKDKDLEEYFQSVGEGKQSEQAKRLIRMGLAAQGLNMLQLLAERGLISPVAAEAIGSGAGSDKAVSEQQAQEFLNNMAASWSD